MGQALGIYLSEAMRVNINGSGGTGGQIDYPYLTGGPIDPANPRGAGWNWATWRISHKKKANAVFYDLRVQTVGWDDSNPTHNDQGPGNMWNGRWDSQW